MCLVHAVCSQSLLLLATCTGLDIWAGSVEALIPAILLQAHAGLPTILGPARLLLLPDGASWFLLVSASQVAEVWTGNSSLVRSGLDTEDGAGRTEGLWGPWETLLAPEGGARMDYSSPFFSSLGPCSVLPRGYVHLLRFQGQLPSVGSLRKYGQGRRDLPFPGHTIAMQTGPHIIFCCPGH